MKITDKMAKMKIKKRGFFEGIASFVDRHPRLSLLAILCLALILRVMALMSLKGTIYFDFLLWDEQVYHQWAIRILKGTSVSLNLFAGIIALIYKIFSQDILYIRILNIILDVLTCYLIYLIGKEMMNHRIGLLACLIASLYKPFIFYSIVPLNTVLSVFLFALTIYLFASVLKRDSIIKTLILGVAIGLLYNVRPNFIFLIPLVPLFILWNSIRGGSLSRVLVMALLIYIIGLSFSLVPFTITRYRPSGNSIATTSQIGLNLYLGNNLGNPDPYYRPVSFASSSPVEQARDFNIEASRRVGKKLSTRESSNYWINEVFREAQDQPSAFSWKIFQKTLILLNRFEAGDHYHIGFMSRFAHFFSLPFFSFWIILPFGMAGMAVTVGRSRKLQFLSSILFLYGLTLIVFFTNTRYRLPIMVMLIPFAVMGIDILISNMKKKDTKGVAVYLTVVAIIFIIEFLPVRGTDDLTAYYNTHAIILSSKGLDNEAIEYWEESSLMNKPYSAFANLYLASKYLGRNNVLKAKEYLDKVPEDSFAVSSKYQLLGDIGRSEGKAEEAVKAYEKSIEINSGNIVSRQRLINVLWRTDRERALREYDLLEAMDYPGKAG
jgi:hypothetical protein